MRRVLLVFALVIACGSASAQRALLLGAGGAYSAPASGYIGPNDVLAGSWLAWYSCSFSFSASFASGSNNACLLRRASDSTTQEIKILASGSFDTASANTFAGTDASCTGSMVGTATLTITACSSGTLHVNDTLTGAGITQPAYITSIGTCASPPGTCTVNQSQTFVSEPVTAQVALTVVKLHDQNGGGATLDLAASGTEARWLPDTGLGQPGVFLTGSQGAYLTSGNIAATPQPYSWTAVAARTGAFTTQATLFGINSGGNNQFSFASSTNTMFIYTGAVLNGTASDSVLHGIQAVANDPSGADINIDGTRTTGATGNGAATAPVIMGAGLGNAASTGYLGEMGFRSGGFTSGNETSLCHNQFVRWAFPTSC